ncbi:LD-carboxypeptidase [Bergeyella porcorum]|uniref:LD-carboxypeptidase n=1 Tax=Bergeyella porcorum TaxID=1735111 RepID=A0AAU0F293_9FLAO
MIFNLLEGKDIQHTLKPHSLNRKGKAKGRLVGGNLALIYALLGTRYSFDFKDNILFIEEIGESFYALDRMLMSLEMAGAFKKIAGLVVGGMINMGKEKDNKDYEFSFDNFAYELIYNRIERYNFPVIFGF